MLQFAHPHVVDGVPPEPQLPVQAGVLSMSRAQASDSSERNRPGPFLAGAIKSSFEFHGSPHCPP